MLKKVLGWTLFICGIVAAFYALSPTITNVLQAVGSLLELLGSSKFWVLLAGGIAISWGWDLSHRDNKRKMTLRNAKSSAYDMVDRFCVFQLKEEIDYYQLGMLKKRNTMAEIKEALSKISWKDREARHLLYELSELERALEKISVQQIEKETGVKIEELEENPLLTLYVQTLKKMSDSELLEMKKKSKSSEFIVKKIDDILNARTEKKE